MTAHGPAPTPTNKLRLRGSWRANTRPGEPRPKAARPQPPPWLSADARAVFQAIARQLHAEGMVTRLDEAALARYADLCVHYRQASEFLAKFGAVYAVPGRPGPDGKPGPSTGFRPYPQAQRALALASELLRLEDRFGLSPAARARIIVETPVVSEPAFDYFQPMKVVG